MSSRWQGNPLRYISDTTRKLTYRRHALALRTRAQSRLIRSLQRAGFCERTQEDILDDCICTFLAACDQRRSERVTVALKEPMRRVLNAAGVVLQGELVFVHFVGLVVRLLQQVLRVLLHQRAVTRTWEVAFFVQQGEHAKLCKEHVQQRSVIHKRNLCRVHPLFAILCQLVFKDVLVEEILQLFVGHVDAQLLKTINNKVFETKDVEDADRCGTGLRYHRLRRKKEIDLRYDPSENPTVDLLTEGITDIAGAVEDTVTTQSTFQNDTLLARKRM